VSAGETPAARPFVSRHRRLLVWLLALAIAAVFVLMASAIFTSAPKPRVVPIPAADRNAPRSLIRAAERLGYRPARKSDSIENGPAISAPAPDPDLLPVGSAAPAFALKTPAGKAVALERLRGKAVLLEFFASWCPHCAAEAPHLRRLALSLPRRKVAFVSVNADSEDGPSVFAYHVWFGLPFPAALDPGDRKVTWPDHGPIGPVSSRYRVKQFPTFYVIAPDGRIAWRSAGEQPDAILRRELERAAST
jgi:thiol-disulfide isomerase/thioredoxin